PNRTSVICSTLSRQYPGNRTDVVPTAARGNCVVMTSDPGVDRGSTLSEELELVGWRRTVGELYAAVRAEQDPRRGHELWRRGRDELFLSHPLSPLPPGDPLRATGVPYWPYDPGLRFELPLLPSERELSLSVPT